MTNPSRESALLTFLERAGYPRIAPPLLQPADVFLDLSGEDLRKRLFLTQDDAGRELCLRPEFTIPVCREYLASGAAGKPATFSYLGPVFRQRPNASAEFLQAGCESFARKDTAAADAEILDLALGMAAELGGADAPRTVRMGDIGLLDAAFAALEVPAGAARRIRRVLAGGGAAETALAAVEAPAAGALDEYAGVLRALEGVEPRAARAFVEDMLSIAGISSVGGRSVAEIAERFLDKASHGANALPTRTRDVLGALLAISGDPDSVSDAARAVAREAGLDLSASLDLFESRTGFLAARGVDLALIEASPAFARNLDYYTGFVFEIGAPGLERPLVGGGRYDRLLGRLGFEGGLPAVGCSVWLDRFETAEAKS